MIGGGLVLVLVRGQRKRDRAAAPVPLRTDSHAHVPGAARLAPASPLLSPPPLPPAPGSKLGTGLHAGRVDAAAAPRGQTAGDRGTARADPRARTRRWHA